MDIVVCSHLKDFRLLNLFFQSYDLYYQDKGQLILFIWRWEQIYLNQLHQPAGLRVIYKDDIAELDPQRDFNNQLYLKLIAYRYVQSEYFLVCDSDFLFCAPTYAKDFFDAAGKPYWFAQSWNDQNSVWCHGTEIILKQAIPYQFMELPQYVFKKEIATALTQDYPVNQLLLQTECSEFLLHAAYAYHHPVFRHDYHWCFCGDYRILPIAHCVNQILPNYMQLDPEIKFHDFKAFKLLAFWSHWEFAETKMAEFFEASQQMHFGIIRQPIAIGTDLNFGLTIQTISHWRAFITGIDADGWVHETIHLTIADANLKSIILECDIPGRADGQPNFVTIYNGDQAYPLSPGLQKLTLSAMQSQQPILLSLKIDGGFIALGADKRQLRFRLLNISVDT